MSTRCQTRTCRIWSCYGPDSLLCPFFPLGTISMFCSVVCWKCVIFFWGGGIRVKRLSCISEENRLLNSAGTVKNCEDFWCWVLYCFLPEVAVMSSHRGRRCFAESWGRNNISSVNPANYCDWLSRGLVVMEWMKLPDWLLGSHPKKECVPDTVKTGLRSCWWGRDHRP